MINNELKSFLAHADTRCTFAQSEQTETRTYNYRCQKVVPLYNGLLTTVFLFIVYIDKNTDHVRIDIKQHFQLLMHE